MPSNFIDMKIPVPYGYIAAKVWGNLRDDSIKCVAMHGYMDNAGTFDRLIPLLPNQFYVVAIDLPGHGLSSHVPFGTPYDDSTWALALRHVLDFLRFDKFTIIGHSMGASIGFFYASILPSQVARIIVFDQVKPFTCESARHAAELYGESMLSYCEIEKKYKATQQTFSPETSLDILIVAHEGFGVKLDRQSAQCLVKRATKPSPDGPGVTFTRDARLSALLGNKADAEGCRDFYSRMSCEMLMILGKESNINDLNDPATRTVFEEHKRRKNFKCFIVDGDHFVHLAKPEHVAKIVSDYVLNPENLNSDTEFKG